MSKRTIIIVTVLIVLGLICIVTIGISKKYVQHAITKSELELELKTNKDAIYDLFNNFPKSNNIYYTSKNLYSERSIGPTIYQIDILAELTNEAYDYFINKVEFESLGTAEVKVNPYNINYDWKKIKNIGVIESKDIEDASIRSIYLDERTKTIYVVALGGN